MPNYRATEGAELLLGEARLAVLHEAQDALQQLRDAHSTQVVKQHGPGEGAAGAGGQHHLVGRHLLLDAHQLRPGLLVHVLPDDHLQQGGNVRIKVVQLQIQTEFVVIIITPVSADGLIHGYLILKKLNQKWI